MPAMKIVSLSTVERNKQTKKKLGKKKILKEIKEKLGTLARSTGLDEAEVEPVAG